MYTIPLACSVGLSRIARALALSPDTTSLYCSLLVHPLWLHSLILFFLLLQEQTFSPSLLLSLPFFSQCPTRVHTLSRALKHLMRTTTANPAINNSSFCARPRAREYTAMGEIYPHIRTHTHAHTYTYTCTHTRTHMYTHTHTHTRTNAHVNNQRVMSKKNS